MHASPLMLPFALPCCWVPLPLPLFLVPQQALQLLQRFDELCREQSKVGGWEGCTDCAPALPPTTGVCCLQQGHCKRAPDHVAPPPLTARHSPLPQPRHTLATAARLVRHIWWPALLAWYRAGGASPTDTRGESGVLLLAVVEPVHPTPTLPCEPFCTEPLVKQAECQGGKGEGQGAVLVCSSSNPSSGVLSWEGARERWVGIW